MNLLLKIFIQGKFLCVVLMLSSVISKLFSQNTWQIPLDSSSEWVEQNGFFDGVGCYSNFALRHYFTADTVIGNHSYKILEATGIRNLTHVGISPYPENCDSTWYPYSQREGYIRNDSGKVYFLPFNQSQERLLYDFTLAVGDTLQDDYFAMPIFYIDSVQISNVYHKRFWVTDPYNSDSLWYIEGIGGKGGLLSIASDFFESYSTFYCYAEHETPVFGDMTCQLNIGIENSSETKTELKIYPSPVTDLATIHFTSEAFSALIISVRNITGQTIMERTEKAFAGSNTFDLNCTVLPPGIYLVQLKTEQKNYSEKLLVQ